MSMAFSDAVGAGVVALDGVLANRCTKNNGVSLAERYSILYVGERRGNRLLMAARRYWRRVRKTERTSGERPAAHQAGT